MDANKRFCSCLERYCQPNVTILWHEQCHLWLSIWTQFHPKQGDPGRQSEGQLGRRETVAGNSLASLPSRPPGAQGGNHTFR